MNFKVKNRARLGMAVMLVILMILSGSLWARGVYTWTDENGVVNYSDRMRAQDKRASIINVKVKSDYAGDSGDEAASAGETESAQGEADQAVANARAEKAQKSLRKANCTKARDQLAANESMSRMYRAGKNSERQYLTDKERGAVIKRSLDSVKHWCD